MPTSRTDLNELRANELNWPEGQIHNGAHPGSYYEGLDVILRGLPENPTPEDVVDILDAISDAIVSGELRPVDS